MSAARFITFEGIDGAGKSSHIEACAQWLRERGHRVVQTREPGGTPLAESLRELLLHRRMDALTEALIVFAARRDHLQTVIEPALATGETVLCDRFTDATFAYQGGGRGFDLLVLATLEQWVQGRGQPAGALCEPHMTLWFDLDPGIAAQRLAGARVPDRFESQPAAFFAAVREGYAARAQAAPQRFVRLDAAQERHKVWQQITSALVRRGWLAIMVSATGGGNAIRAGS